MSPDNENMRDALGVNPETKDVPITVEALALVLDPMSKIIDENY